MLGLRYALPSPSDMWTLATIVVCAMSKVSIVLVQFYDEAATAAAVKPIVIASIAIIGKYLFQDSITVEAWILIGCIIISFVVYESIKSAWMRSYVVAFPYHRESKTVLLGLQKRGIFKGYVNGYGGKIDPGEDPVKAAYRELEEESGMALHQGMTLVGLKVGKGAINFVFTCEINDYQKAQVAETEEAVPQWQPLNTIIDEISSSNAQYALVATNIELICRHLQVGIGEGIHKPVDEEDGKLTAKDSHRSIIITRKTPNAFTPLAYKFEQGSDEVMLIPVEKQGPLRCRDPAPQTWAQRSFR
uniref:Nudix hydrolase domain-containing protein n=2 Tax=Lotharella globosa TaxID=91324 RepID=A0A7S4DW73_9EUKA